MITPVAAQFNPAGPQLTALALAASWYTQQ
jgi:hypothetical protein